MNTLWGGAPQLRSWGVVEGLTRSVFGIVFGRRDGLIVFERGSLYKGLF